MKRTVEVKEHYRRRRFLDKDGNSQYELEKIVGHTKYIEQTLYFKEIQTKDELKLDKEPLSKSAGTIPRHRTGSAEVLGIHLQLGNQPIVTNLRKVLESIHGVLPPKMEALFQEKEIYTIVHAVGITRLEGSAKVDELHYEAEMIDEDGNTLKDAQTIDLIPHTRFKQVIKANVNFEGSLSVNGNAMAKLPESLTKGLLQEYVSVGGAMHLQLSNSNSFVGKFTYSLKYPVVISTGIASNRCQWVLKPDKIKTPLLGDQLLVQTISVPKSKSKIRFMLKGMVKVGNGFFSKQLTKETDEYEVEVGLS